MKKLVLGVALFSPSFFVAANDCYDLWYQRNLISAKKGYCFESNLGKEVFKGFECSTHSPKFSSDEKKIIEQIKAKEHQLNCNINTTLTKANDSIDSSTTAEVPTAIADKIEPKPQVAQQSETFNKIAISLGWNAAPLGEKMDLDISAFLVKPDGKMRSDDATDFCFYSNKVIANGAIQHTGDNSDGKGNGDDETINVESSKIPHEMDKVIFTITFNNDEELKHKFRQIYNAYVRIINQETGVEIAKYDLNKVAPNESSLIFGELYRSGDGWKFRVLNKGFGGGLGAISKSFGVASYYSGQ